MAIDAKDLESLDQRVLKILDSSDAIVSSYPKEFNLKAFYAKLQSVYKSSKKYENILNTVMFFVDEDDYARCLKENENKIVQKAPETEMKTLLDDLEFWSGLSQD